MSPAAIHGPIQSSHTFQSEHGFSLKHLGPQNLIMQQAEEAQRAFESLTTHSNVPSLGRSGPQGNIIPFTTVEDPSAWTAASVKDSKDWIYTLEDQDLAEIENALLNVKGLDVREEGNLLHIQEKVKSTKEFPLPSLGPKLKKFRDEVVSGRGFFLIRGLPVDNYTRQEVLTVYWGFGLWWGKVVSQNAKGHIVGHVKNIGHDINLPTTRVYATPLAQPWHNDSADIVALLCLKQAKEGGLSSWASSISVHNEILRHGRQDLVEEMTKPIWWIDRKGEVPAGTKEAYQQQIFQYHDGYLSVNHTGTYYHLAQRHASVPRMTAKQLQALAVFNALAGSDKLRMDFTLQPGDIQLLNNLTMQHRRSSFIDHEDVSQRRHLLRLWISPEENRPLPEEYNALWNSTVPGLRGGIRVTGDLTVPLEAE